MNLGYSIMTDKFWTDDFDVGYYDKILEKGLEKGRGLQAFWHNETLSKVASKFEGALTHLDYATGPGTLIGKYTQSNSLGVDLSTSQINYANQKYGEKGEFKTIKEFQFQHYQNTFDVITVIGLLEFLSTQQAKELLKNLKKTLKKNGTIILTTPNYGGVFNYLQKFVYIFSNVNYEEALETKYTQKKIDALMLNENFSSIKVNKFMTFGWTLSLVSFRLAKVLNNILENITQNKFGFLYMIELKK